MPKRYLFRKWDSSEDYTSCSICGAKTLFFILDKKTREELFCCSECALKKYKIKRLKKLMEQYSTSPKKAILKQNSLIKNSENNASAPDLKPSVPIQQKLLEVAKDE
jgi:hypothetical protein